MLEFGQAKDTAAAGDLIRDVNEASFMADVIEASKEVPVIVDFWAPWCGPCKTLGPALEAAVTAAKGKVRMAKVNVDENQVIAGQLRIQSIPTVYAFWQGKPVDGFQGAVPVSEIKAFVDKLAALAGDGGLGEALDAADAMLADGAAVDAAETFAAILGEEPENARAYGGLVRAHLALGNEEQAEGLLANVPTAIAGSAEVEAAKAQLALLKQAAKAGPVAELLDRVLAHPDDQSGALRSRPGTPCRRQGRGRGRGASRTRQARPRMERRRRQEAALHHFRGAEAQRSGGAQGPAEIVFVALCVTPAAR